MKDKPTAELIRDARRLNREMCELLAATHYSYEEGCDAWVKMTKLFPEIQRNQEALADRLEVVERVLPRVYEYHQEHEATKARLAEAERVIDDLCSGADILADGPDDSAEAKGEELVAQAVSAADAYHDKYRRGSDARLQKTRIGEAQG